MPQQTLPGFPEGWSYFVSWQDLVLAFGGVVAVIFLLIWWAQQTRRWYRIAIFTFLIAFALSFVSVYLFEVPPYYAGCPPGCMGWRGFPLPVARISQRGLDGYWPLRLPAEPVAALADRPAGVPGGPAGGDGAQLGESLAAGARVVLFVVLLVPWALLPRYLDPPQPATTGEELRLVTNARRAAEMTYGITGLWVQRLALEDVRQLSPNPLSEAAPELNPELQHRAQPGLSARLHLFLHAVAPLPCRPGADGRHGAGCGRAALGGSLLGVSQATIRSCLRLSDRLVNRLENSNRK